MENRQRKFLAELVRKASARKETGLYVIDGPRSAAEADPEQVERVYLTEEFLRSPGCASCRKLLEARGYTVISSSEMRQISDTVAPQGILLTARQVNYGGLHEFAAAERAYASREGLGLPLLLILETLQDPGNLGTIVRMAEASGITGIISDAGTADIYSPKVVRSTMGAVMRVPYLRLDDLKKAAGSIKQGAIRPWAGMRISAAALQDTAKDYTSEDFTGASAYMIGNEAHGLSSGLVSLADSVIAIPMLGHTESLNAAVAASVIAFEAARQRRFKRV